jgi:hypothetical protein
MNWKTVTGNSDYLVSEDGSIKSLKWGKERILTLHPDKNGYLTFNVTAPGTRQRLLKVHREVALAFLPDPPSSDHTQVAHKDGNPQNNACTNLYWATPGENADDKVKHGRAPTRRQILVPAQVVEIRSSSDSQYDLARRYGVSCSTIVDIRMRRTWAHL